MEYLQVSGVGGKSASIWNTIEYLQLQLEYQQVSRIARISASIMNTWNIYKYLENSWDICKFLEQLEHWVM
jgi:hypothetical protein